MTTLQVRMFCIWIGKVATNSDMQDSASFWCKDSWNKKGQKNYWKWPEMEKITMRKYNRAMRSPTMLGNWTWKRIDDCLMWLILWITLLNIEKIKCYLEINIRSGCKTGPKFGVLLYCSPLPWPILFNSCPESCLLLRSPFLFGRSHCSFYLFHPFCRRQNC